MVHLQPPFQMVFLRVVHLLSNWQSTVGRKGRRLHLPSEGSGSILSTPKTSVSILVSSETKPSGVSQKSSFDSSIKSQSSGIHEHQSISTPNNFPASSSSSVRSVSGELTSRNIARPTEKSSGRAIPSQTASREGSSSSNASPSLVQSPSERLPGLSSIISSLRAQTTLLPIQSSLLNSLEGLKSTISPSKSSESSGSASLTGRESLGPVTSISKPSFASSQDRESSMVSLSPSQSAVSVETPS